MNIIKRHSWHKVVGLWFILMLTMSFSLNAEPVKIMLLGDSITEGMAEIPDTPENNNSTYTSGFITWDDNIAYRGELWRLLKAEGYQFGTDVDFVGNQKRGRNYTDSDFDQDNEGHGGFTSSQIENRIDTWLRATPADMVLLHIGTNDGGYGMTIGNYTDLDKDANTTVNNVRKILNTIFELNPNTKVFVARIIEAKRTEAKIAWRTESMNNAVENMVNAHEKFANIKMVNMQNGAGIDYETGGTDNGDMQPFHSDDNNTYDYHPNENGYVKMAQKWFDDMKASGWLVSDTNKPVITLIGDNPQNLTVGDPYLELGATAIDDDDFNLTVDIMIVNDINISAEGNYTVTYTVTDTEGNVAEENRTVVVTSVLVPPVLDVDTDNNGILDTEEQEWFEYDKPTQNATITPIGKNTQSRLVIEEGLLAIPQASSKAISLTHALTGVSQAYIKAQDNGQINTGFINGSENDATLKMSTMFKAGTEAVIKKERGKVIIEISVNLNQGESLFLGR